jgi:hypothetical protein
VAVIELTTFRLRPGVDEAALVAADAAVQTAFAYQQRGLRRRTTAKGADGEWLVSTLWDSVDDAKRAEAAAPQDPAAAAFAALTVDVSVRRYEPLPG